MFHLSQGTEWKAVAKLGKGGGIKQLELGEDPGEEELT